MEKVCIIIPAYNEEKRIGRTLEEYGKYFEDLKKKKILDYEIVVVINNTKDNTEEIVKRYMKEFKEIKYLNFKQGGKGFAIIEGFKYALTKDFNLIGFLDADMSTRPEHYYDLINNIRNYWGIIASRYVKKAIVQPKQSFARIFVSRIFNFLIRFLFLMPYADTQCGAKIFRRKAIEEIIQELQITQWAFDIDLIYKLRRKKFKIIEFPTVWADKEYSKINFLRAGPRMALAVMRLRLINSKVRFIVRGYDLLPNWMKIHKRVL